MRLVEILNYFHDSPLLSKSLVLKGGTAINLTIFRRFVRNSCLCLGAVSILTLKKPRQKWKTFSQSYWFWQNQRKNMCGNSMTRSIFQNCCSKIKRWSIESNFILWLCGRQGVVECFFCKFWKKLLFCLVFWFPQLYIQYMDYKTENRLWVNIW